MMPDATWVAMLVEEFLIFGISNSRSSQWSGKERITNRNNTHQWRMKGL